MIFKLKQLAQCTLAAAAFCLSSFAGATPITVTETAFVTGTGFADASNRLGVTFVASALPAMFDLTSANPFFQFNFGKITFKEDCINGPQSACPTGNGNETQNLEVGAQFAFAGALPGVTSNALTAAFVGTAGDDAVDFYINFSPVLVQFGNGGSFILDLTDAYFNKANQSVDVFASFSLLTPDVPLVAAPAPSDVPEPASLALLALGLAGLGLARRRK